MTIPKVAMKDDDDDDVVMMMKNSGDADKRMVTAVLPNENE